MSINHRIFSWASLLAVALASCTGSNDVEVGTLNVSVSTTGSNPDADGYSITVGQRSAEPIAADGDITVTELLPGDYPVRLSGLAANCYVVGTNPVTGRIVAGARATASFDVSCPGTGARVKVTTTTTGSDLDPDGYLVKIGETSQRVSSQGTTSISLVEEGALAVQVTDVAANCTPDPANPATVTAAIATEAQMALKFACAPSTGAVKVTVTTSGADMQASGFEVHVNTTARTLDESKTATFTGVAPGIVSVSLLAYSVASNCQLTGAGTLTVAVTIGVTTEANFPVACTPRPHVIASVSTLGQDQDADGYTVHLSYYDYYYYGEAYAFAAGSNAMTRGPAVEPTTYQVTVDGLAPNCQVTSMTPNPLVVGSTDATLTISVQCDRARQLAFVSGQGSASEIGVGSEAGTFTLLTSNTVADSNPAWSPDGNRLAFASARDGNSEIYVMNADGSNVLRLTSNSAADCQPTWSSDGTRIAFVSQRDGNPEIYVMNADGLNQVRLTTNTGLDAEPAWSPSGDRILFVSRHGVPNAYIYVMNADGTGVAQLSPSGFVTASPAWSASGGQVAYMRFGTFNTYTLHLMNADGSGVTDQLISGLTGLTWGPDARIALTQVNGCNGFSCQGFAVSIRRLDGSVAQLPWTSSSEPAWRP